ncbi:RNA polymerase I-specific transcription initiation factor RRN3 [Phellopilus nigrolimitatus]|nr:RNA polymerase I-specific transcription initiation factor RRN3 [Phellopilus nigrolimitatus]
MEPKTTSVFDRFRKSASSASGFSTSSPGGVSTPTPFASRPRSRSGSLSALGLGGPRGLDTGSRSGSVNDLNGLAARPIASNARVRRDEKYRRDLYLAFVDNALTQKAQGVSEHYDDLVRQFSPAPGASSAAQSQQPALTFQLRAYLTALAHVVSKLDRAHVALVDAIVGMPWTTMDATFVKAYISFICMLVSARPEYLMLVLERAAQNLTYHSARRALDSGFAESSATPLTRRIVYDRVHSILEQLLSLIPTLPATLFPLLARNFPHKRQSQAEHVTYIRNLLQLSDYCPELWDRILGLVVDRTIQIDVEIQVELEELETTGADDDTEEVFHLDVFDTVIGQEGDESDSDSDGEDDDGGLSDLSSDAGSVGSDIRKEEQMNVKHVQDMVSKLDSILEVIFKHLDHLHSTITASPEHSRLSPAPLDSSVMDSSLPTSTPNPQSTLLSIFERTILRTFKSRYTQFLIFWYSSLDTQFRDRFLGTVVSTALLEPAQPVVTRAAAASYVASYVSRAAFVAREETQMVVRVLCQFLETHLGEFDAYAQQSAEQHAVFYAAVQAVFLIFCFRWRDLMQYDENEGDCRRIFLNVMQRVVNSPLNPLKVCSSNVVQQFARVAQRVAFIYCFSILEANRRSEFSPDTKGKGVATGAAAMSRSFDADLTTFFPFDPFKLPRSSGYIEGIYREWTSDLNMHGPASFADDAGGLGESFGGMSISPAHPRQVTVA